MRSWLPRLAIVLLMLCVLLIAATARAQDDEDFVWYEDDEPVEEGSGYSGLWMSLIIKAIFGTKLGGLLAIGGLAGLGTVARNVFGPFGPGATSKSAHTARGRYSPPVGPTQKTCQKCNGLNLPTAKSCYYCGESFQFGHMSSANDPMAPSPSQQPQQPQYYSAKLGMLVNADGTPVAPPTPAAPPAPASGLSSSALMSPGSAMSSSALMSPGSATSASALMAPSSSTSYSSSSSAAASSSPYTSPMQSSAGSRPMSSSASSAYASTSRPKVMLAPTVKTSERPRGAKVCRECGSGSPTCAVRCFTCATPI